MYGHSLIINLSLGMYQEIHPCRASSIDSSIGNLEGRGVQNPRPWEISRASGDVFPNTSLLSAVYGSITIINIFGAKIIVIFVIIIIMTTEFQSFE